MAKAKPSTAVAPAKIGLWSGYGVPENLPPAWRYVWCGGYDEVDIIDLDGNPAKKREYHHFSNKKCNCSPGPQVIALTTQADEVALGGGRGGLKTETGFAFIIRGNPGAMPDFPLFHFTKECKSRAAQIHAKRGDERVIARQFAEHFESIGVGKIIPVSASDANISYIHHPLYRVLVLRKTADDLRDWYRRGKEFFGRFGAVGTESPNMLIKFPSGAEIVLNHLQDENVYEKYQGQEFQTIVFEEATQVPTELLYLRVRASCRSSVPELKPRVLLTANPGGKGNQWFKQRFIDLTDDQGAPFPIGNVYREPKSGRNRIFIHSTVYDNPYFMRDNAGYVANLEELPETERRKWLLGDFDVAEGQYFTEFRAKPVPGEPKEALHVIPSSSVPLMPWLHRWIGMDWGFRHCSAVYWACQHPNSQVHLYRELVVEQIGAEALGVMVAERSIEDLDGLETKHMTLYLSPDAFGKRNDEKTIAEQFAAGIAKVLGPEHVILPDGSSLDYFQQRELQSQAGITIRRAQNARISGWQYMRQLMRWKPLAQATGFNPDYARELSILDLGKYHRYLKDHEVKPEVLPKLQIHGDKCPMLVRAVPTAIYDDDLEDVLKTKTREDDILDAARYTLVAHTSEQNRLPFQSHFENHMNRVFEGRTNIDGNSLVWAARRAEQKWNQENGDNDVFTVPRMAGRRMRMAVQ